MTLMKSNTTRRSQPMIRSRLRKPTSKSMTTVFLPSSARPVAMAAAEVVLPTPPLPDVTTMTLAKFPSSCRSSRPHPRAQDKALNHQPLALELDAGTSALVLLVDLLAHQVHAGDRQQLGLELVAEDQRGLVALDAGEGAAAQGAIDVDVAGGGELGAGADRGERRRGRPRPTICWPPRTGSVTTCAGRLRGAEATARGGWRRSGRRLVDRLTRWAARRRTRRGPPPMAASFHSAVPF